MTFQKPRPYIWRGKTYKTMRGLHAAALAIHPGCSLSFGRDAMFLRIGRSSQTVAYARDLASNTISNNPMSDIDLVKMIADEKREEI